MNEQIKTLAEIEKEAILKSLVRNKFNKRLTSQELGLPTKLTTFHRQVLFALFRP